MPITPTLVYHTAFLMEDGSHNDMTIDKSYEIISAYSCDDVVCVNIQTDHGDVHIFELGTDSSGFDYSKYFDLVGDYTEVWEAVDDEYEEGWEAVDD